MNEKQAKTVKRVIKKLNAMRTTLTKPERAILDALIVREAEVKGHAMNVSAVSANAHLGDAASTNAATVNAVNADAVQADAMQADAVVAEAVIGLAATGYVVELR